MLHSILFARRGGVLRLIFRAVEGDPVAIGILAVLALIFGGFFVYQMRKGDDDSPEEA